MPHERKFKKVRHFHEPGDLHELTFSCYRHLQLLTDDAWLAYLARAIDEANLRFRFQLVAFVFMPNHVHLLVFPIDREPNISSYLAAVKRPVSAQAKQDLQLRDKILLRRLTIRERPGKEAFRFWQEGPGYDRNLRSSAAVTSSMDYIHLNPVRRNFVKKAREWKWSSARAYESDFQEIDADLPMITPMPAEFWN